MLTKKCCNAAYRQKYPLQFSGAWCDSSPCPHCHKAGEQPCGVKMVEHSSHFVYFRRLEYEPIDQVYVCLFLASKTGGHEKGQTIQVCNRNFYKKHS